MLHLPDKSLWINFSNLPNSYTRNEDFVTLLWALLMLPCAEELVSQTEVLGDFIVFMLARGFSDPFFYQILPIIIETGEKLVLLSLQSGMQGGDF